MNGDILRHCVYLRESSSDHKNTFTAKDLTRQAAEDVLAVWQKLSSRFSGDVIMTIFNIQRKIEQMLERFKKLTIKTTGVIKKSQLQKLAVEVGQFFDILYCKK